MSRRFILGIIFVVVILGFAGWLFFSSNKNSTGGSGAQAAPSESDGGLGSLFPYGTPTPPAQNQTPSVPAPASSGTTGTQTTAAAPSPLTQISTRVVAGLTVLPLSTTPAPATFNAQTGTETPASAPLPVVRFVESGTGYIYDIDAKGQNESEISGTTIATALLASFGDAGNTVIVRYIKTDGVTVATYLGHITPPASSGAVGSVKGSFLPDNIFDLAVSPDGKSLLYLIPTTDGTAGITMKTDGTGKKQIFTSPFTEWLVDWTKGATTITTKAAADYAGYAYKVTSSGALQKIIGGVNGLTTNISPDGNTVLYSIGEQGTLELHALHLKDGTDTNLGLSTLPEKCVWSTDSVTAYCGATSGIPAGAYPDAWYQGTFHFSDGIWKINTAVGTTSVVNAGSGDFFDATDLALDPSGQYLFFVNKNDGTLWSLDLSSS